MKNPHTLDQNPDPVHEYSTQSKTLVSCFLMPTWLASTGSVIWLSAVRRTSPFSRAGASGAPRRAGTAVRKGSDADSIYYLNRANYLTSVLSHRDPSSPKSLDLRVAQNGFAPAQRAGLAWHAVRKTNSQPVIRACLHKSIAGLCSNVRQVSLCLAIIPL